MPSVAADATPAADPKGPQTGSLADEVQVAAFFRNEPGMPVSLYTSVDGMAFTTPSDGAIGGAANSIYDPSIMYRDGYFWLVSGVRVNNAPGLAVKYSSDLRTWHDLWTQTLPSGTDAEGNDLIGAEWFQDADALYVIASIGKYWTENGSPLGSAESLRPYAVRVALPQAPTPGAAFTAGPSARLNLSTNPNDDRIDGFMRRDPLSGDLQFIVKPRATQPLELWTAKTIEGEWTLANPNIFSLRVDDDYRMMEAPSVAPVAGRYAVYADNFNHRYGGQDHIVGMTVSYTTDFRSFTTPRQLLGADGNPISVRHGTVITVSDPHARCVVWAFRTGSVCDDTTTAPNVRASVRPLGTLAVGRTTQFSVTLTNEGATDATGVTASLTTSTALATSDRTQWSGLTVPAHSTVSMVATMSVSSRAPAGSIAAVAARAVSTGCRSSASCSAQARAVIRSGVPSAPDTPYMRQQRARSAASDCLPTTANDPGGQNITLCWGAPDDDGGFAITSYIVQARDDDGAVQLSTTLTPSTTQWTLYALPGRRLYSLSVIAQTDTSASPAAHPVYSDGTGTHELQVWVDSGLAFFDVSPDAGWWNSNAFAAEITWMAASGISTGNPDGSYRPADPVKRDAMAAFLYRAAGSPPVYASTSPFSDVDPQNPFFKAIVWMSTSGISTGWADGTFRPDQAITRDAMAAFLYRFAHAAATPPTQSSFVDVDPSNPFYTQISWMATTGISTGWNTANGREYRPWDPISREAMAAFLFRYTFRNQMIR